MYYFELECNKPVNHNTKYQQEHRTDEQNHRSARVQGQAISQRFGITLQACRAGGKPSTWFRPGTRGADHLICYSLLQISSMHIFFKPFVLHRLQFFQIYRKLNVHDFCNILLNTTGSQHQRFARPPRPILTQNETSKHYMKLKCDK